MAEFAIVDNGNTLVGFKDFAGVPPALPGKPYRRILPVEVTSPSFDPATQVSEGPVLTILVDKVTRIWTVRSKTAQELDDEKASAVSRVDSVLVKALFNHENRVRVLEAKAPMTMVQFLAALKALL